MSICHTVVTVESQMANIRKRNGKFQVQIRTAGKSQSKTFLHLDSARKWAREVEAELYRRADTAQRYEPKNLAEVLAVYLERETPKKSDAASEAYVLRCLMKEPWIQKPIARLMKSDLIAYRERRLANVQPSTLRRQYGILRAACRLAQTDWDWSVPHALISSLALPRVTKHVPERLSPENEDKLLCAARAGRCAFLEPVIILALETAMRRSEIARLVPSDVDLGRGHIVLRRTKNGYPRLVPISERLRLSCFGQHDLCTAPVFAASAEGIKSAFRRARIRAGLAHLRFHDLRHEAVSRLFEKGLTVPEVASVSGHRDFSVLQHYSHADLNRIKAIIG